MSNELVNAIYDVSKVQFAVIGECPTYGSGILSFHGDVFSAKRTVENLKAIGGQVQYVPAPAGKIAPDYIQLAISFTNMGNLRYAKQDSRIF